MARFFPLSGLPFFASLVVGCATSSPPADIRGWRPVPPAPLIAECSGEAARRCYQDALQALAVDPPNVLRAQDLLAAACSADVSDACRALEAHFQPPSPIKVPSLSLAPPTGTAIVEFICRVSAKGRLNDCRHSRSKGSTHTLDEKLTEQLLAAQSSALFRPSTYDQQPYETEVRLVYELSPTALASEMLPQRTVFRLYAVDPVNYFWKLHPQNPF
jgi:hypothetical protein